MCKHIRDAKHAAIQRGMRYEGHLNCHRRLRSSYMVAWERGTTAHFCVECRVLKMDFIPVVMDTCHAAKEVLHAWLNDVERSEIDGLQCRPLVEHRSPHPQGLVDRVGLENAAAIEHQLNGTAYEWMLDLHATQWPKGHEGVACFEW
eukprot:scaffold225_cov388-Prasinococcus_capsulatus_cf.AAC.14